MAFIKPTPADGVFARVDGKQWRAEGGKWVADARIAHKNANNTSWAWAELKSAADHQIQIRGALLPKAHTSLGLIASDESGTIEFTADLLRGGYAIGRWGDGTGKAFPHWNGIQTPDGPTGIKLNQPVSTKKLSKDHWSFVNVTLLRLGSGVMLNWDMQGKSDNGSELLYSGCGFVDVRMHGWRKVGFKAVDGDFTTCSINAVYY